MYFSMQRINIPSLGVSVLIPWVRWCHPGVCTGRLLFPFGILRQCNTLFLFKLLLADFRSRTINYRQRYTLAFPWRVSHPQSSLYELECFCRRGLSLPPFRFYASEDVCVFILSAGYNPAQSLSRCPSGPCFGRRAPLLFPVWLPGPSFTSSSSEAFLPACPTRCSGSSLHSLPQP